MRTLRDLLFILASAALLSTTAVAQVHKDLKTPATGIYPPWQDGRNNDTIAIGLEFTVPDVDNLADFHGNPLDPLLSLYVCDGVAGRGVRVKISNTKAAYIGRQFHGGCLSGR